MKKTWALIVLAISAAGLLTACGSSDRYEDTGGLPGVTKGEYEEARQAVIDADREWRDENLF